jgi:outer membrane protein assembly factor BamB
MSNSAYLAIRPSVIALLVVASLAAGLFGQVPGSGTAGSGVNNVFPPPDREMRQRLTRAQAALAEERFSDAVGELREIFENPETNDFFLGTAGSGDAQVSLKTQALALLGSMPAKGRELYELDCGAEARAALEKAFSAGDLTQLAEVSRRYFHTKAGYEATLLLGRYQLDQGRPLAAALTFKRVADVPHALAQYDPELSILLATCWVHASQPQQATDALVALKQRSPSAKVRLLDKEAPLFDTDDKALAWLEEIVGGSRLAPAATATQWVMFRGSETRNAATNGGVPLLNFNWKQPGVFDPQDGEKVNQQLRAARDRGEPSISSLQPLVVQDYVIIRQPEANRLLGIHLGTGKIKWVFPPFDENQALAASRVSPVSSRTPPQNLRDQELRQRVWEDNTFGQTSSDGRQVYVIDELGYAPMINISVPQVIVVAGGRRVQNVGYTKNSNTLVALDLKKQGYQNWAVGEKGDNPALSGAFFLGPPLPLGDQLYALAEQSGDIRLLCLNSKDGALDWKQQLAVVEEALPIVYDRVRRLAGASPSYADGVLVCPTSAGAVVAVDLVTRSLRWGYQYPRWDISRSTSMTITSSANRGGIQGHWLDGTATIADGSVVLTPVESQELHCLDLLTGKARWPAQPRDDMLFVACVHDGKIVLVGKNKLKAVHLADGNAGWATTVDLGNEMPTGRGYYSGKHYFLPVTGQHLLKIDLDEGKIVGRAKTEVDLGNVVCYQDQLISQGPQTVAAFFLSEPLQARLEADLQKNPNDVKALALKSQVLLQEGKSTESLNVLRQAHQIAPDDSGIRTLLVKVIFALLRDDFTAHAGLTGEVEKLATDPAQRREALRWHVKGLMQAGQTWDAFETVLELADIELAGASAMSGSSSGLEYVERDLVVRTDRWLQGRLHELMRSADEPTKARMAAEIQLRLQRVMESKNSGQLRAYLNLFGFHDGSQAARLALADQLIAADQLLEAELLAGELLETAEPAIAGTVRAALAALYEKAKRPELAARYYQELAARYGDVVCREGLTGNQLAERAKTVDALRPYLAAAWPAGQTETQPGPLVAGPERNLGFGQRLSYAVPITQFAGAAPRGLKLQYDQNQLLGIRSDLGQPLTFASLRPADGNFRRYYSAATNVLTGRAHGHLVVVNIGSEIVAVDALRGERASVDSVLWRQDSADLDPTQRVYASQKQVSNPLSGLRLVSYDSSGRMNFTTGPLQTTGVCYQKGRQLICADLVTGQSLWERSQIPPQAEIFGDGELLFLADPNSDEALVLSAIDGTDLGKRKLERTDRRWATHGRRVLAWDQTGTTLKVRLYDAWDQDAQGQHPDLWSRQVPQGTKGCLIDGEELALLEPGGQFTVISLATGELRFAVPLEPEPSLDYIQVQRSGSVGGTSSSDQYILMTTQNNPSPPPGLLVTPLGTANSPQSRIHGRVYAFARSTGKLQWQVPGFVAMHCLPIDQPAESPLLLFVRNQNNVGGGRTTQSVSVLCLDKRDGRVVYDGGVTQNGTTAQQASHCDILADPVKRTVTLALITQPSPSSLVFQVTDKPFPPQPPAQTGEVASETAGQPAGTVDGSIGRAIERINRGGNPADLIPAPPPVRGAVPVPR